MNAFQHDNNRPDHSIIHHARLLSDVNRIESFKQAIEKCVSPNSTVVDIGSGTGILAAYAARKTKKTVYAIEYYKFGINLATKIIDNNYTYSNISLVNNSSYATSIQDPLDILITETIGQIGPEENIVEICYDFKRRHPSIKKLIPSKLNIYAEFIYSLKGIQFLESIKNDYFSASLPDYQFQSINMDLHNTLASIVMQTDISDAKAIQDRIMLAEYDLGQTNYSTFSVSIPIQKNYNDALIHLYFEANLGENISLSSRFTEQNHWKHSIFPVAHGKSNVNIEYTSGSEFINITWKD